MWRFAGRDQVEFRRQKNTFEMAQVAQFIFDGDETKLTEKLTQTYLTAK
ncbi:MAG: hypothetical protein JST84_24955 [Acidobacteria bacterium]|nr:hypothetical protein [Acidobacteriota bacterium]